MAATSAAVTPPCGRARPASPARRRRTPARRRARSRPPPGRCRSSGRRRPAAAGLGATAVGSGQVGDVATRADLGDRDAAGGPRPGRSSAPRRCGGGAASATGTPHPCGDGRRRGEARRRRRAARRPPSAASVVDARPPAARPGRRPRRRPRPEHAGGEQRAHLQAVEQAAAAAGDVVEQLGVVLGELVDVRRDPVAVERVGLDEAGRHDRAAEGDLGREVADRAPGDRAERLVGRLLEVVDPAVGEHRRADHQGVGVQLDRPGQQTALARGGVPDVLLDLRVGLGRQLLGRRDLGVAQHGLARAGRGRASPRRTRRRGRPAGAAGRTCRAPVVPDGASTSVSSSGGRSRSSGDLGQDRRQLGGEVARVDGADLDPRLVAVVVRAQAPATRRRAAPTRPRPTTVASPLDDVGHQGAQPPAGLVVQGGQQGAHVEVGDRAPLAVDDRGRRAG